MGAPHRRPRDGSRQPLRCRWRRMATVPVHLREQDLPFSVDQLHVSEHHASRVWEAVLAFGCTISPTHPGRERFPSTPRHLCRAIGIQCSVRQRPSCRYGHDRGVMSRDEHGQPIVRRSRPTSRAGHAARRVRFEQHSGPGTLLPSKPLGNELSSRHEHVQPHLEHTGLRASRHHWEAALTKDADHRPILSEHKGMKARRPLAPRSPAGAAGGGRRSRVAGERCHHDCTSALLGLASGCSTMCRRCRAVGARAVVDEGVECDAVREFDLVK